MTTELAQAAAAFADWRATRRKREHTPPHLIEQALSLVGQYSKREITQHLGINHGMLDRWQRNRSSSVPAFIDLTPSLKPFNETTAVAVGVEFSNGTQVKLTGTTSDIGALLLMLRQGGGL